ncbi:MAG TPA: Ig-like domain-containing protein [Dehalococcoidia bacterium]|nr:Ig-like domain-containing protein [Dehalococcoidia bacterium]
MPEAAWEPAQAGPEAPFSLRPTLGDDLGVDPASRFRLTATDGASPKTVLESLRIDPPAPYRLEEVSWRETEIVPLEPLAPDTVYRFEVSMAKASDQAAEPQSLAWAFQTRGPFRVVETLPRDQGTDIPVDSGIEIVFSHDTARDISGYFHISPPVEGRFEKHKRTIVFVPDELAPNTLYTATIGGDLSPLGSADTLAEPFVFRFETGDTTQGQYTPQPYLSFTREVFEFPPSEPPALSLMAYGLPAEPAVTVDVYSFASLEDFLAALKARDDIPTWAYRARRAYQHDTAGLAKALSFTAPLEGTEATYGQSGYVRFPQALPEGFYLADVSAGGQRAQAWLQITYVATFLSTSRTRTMAWVHDLSTKAPAAGAQLALVDTAFAAIVGQDGVAFFDSPEELRTSEGPRRYFLASTQDGKQAVVPVASCFEFFGSSYGCDWSAYWGWGWGWGEQDASLYWRYLYSDRRFYQPSDSLRFWGVAKGREDGAASDSVTVELVRQGCSETPAGYECREAVTAQTEVTPSSWGTFQGELAFQNLQPDYYYLQAKVGDTVLSSRWGIQIETYVKPAYEIQIEPSARAVFAGDPLSYLIRTQFFEGTPLPEVGLSYVATAPSKLEQSVSGELTTDAQGQATVHAWAAADPSAYADGHYLNVYPTLAEEGEIYSHSSVVVFPADVYVESSAHHADGRATLDVRARRVVLDKLNNAQETDYWYLPPEEFLGDAVAGQRISGQVVLHGWREREVGTRYDFINKVVAKVYEYDYYETKVREFSLTTGAEGEASFSFDVAPDASYEIRLDFVDAQGRLGRATAWLYTGQEPYARSYAPFYLEDVKQATTGSSGYGYYYGGTPFAYKVGEEVEIRFKEGNEALPSGGDNRYLFLRAANGLRSYAVQEDSTHAFPFGEEDIPNVFVQGVYFNGFTYVVSNQLNVAFDRREKELKIEVTPDKDSYRPGETVNLDVLVTDKAGEPVEAEVNLSLVDEALFQLQQDSYWGDDDPLQALYQTVSAGIIETYASHQYPREFLMPGAGGGAPATGGDGGRQDFEDRAFFGALRTGGDGRGSVSFDLPDNLTSWRITSQAVTPSMQAGSNIRHLSVGLPLFVDAAFAGEYLEGDKPVIKLRAFGQDLQPGQAVEFFARAPTLDLEEVTIGGVAFEPVDLALPPLLEGEHAITLGVRAGGLEDAVERPIRVLKTRLTRNEARFYLLSPDLEIEGSALRPTTVVFADHNRGRFYPLLQSLSWTPGFRIDQKLARVKATEFLGQYFGEAAVAEPESFVPSQYQTPEGGIAIFPYADDDLALSAELASLAPDLFDRQGLRNYFWNVVDDPNEGRDRVIIALYGLAALGEPVLFQVQDLLQAVDLSPMEALSLGLAALELGDGESARGAYDSVLTKYGEVRDPYVRVKAGVDQDDILEATSLAAILGAALGDTYHEGLFRYVTDTHTKDILIHLEELLYLSRLLPTLSPEPVRFAFVLDGERREVELASGRTQSLELSPDELAAIRFEDIEGQIAVTSLFAVEASPSDLASDTSISLQREYSAGGGVTTEFVQADVVKVTIRYSLGATPFDGCYQVTDYLPSGLRLITQPYRRGIYDTNLWYPYVVEGQKVSFCVTNDPMSKPIVYYARVVSRGEYQAEPAIVQSLRSFEIANLSESATVTIR